MSIIKEDMLKYGTTFVVRPPYEHSYIINSNGVTVREIEIDSGLGTDETVEISMITDSHVRPTNDSLKALCNALPFAGSFDRMVLCGDSIESSSDKNNVARLKENVWDAYPGTVCVIGNHEQFYGDIPANRAYIDSIWPHDTVHHSEVLKNKVMLVCLDNNTGTYHPSCAELLKKDIEYARSHNLCIIIFQHIVLPRLKMEFPENAEIYETVKASGDVIKAVFSGHNHVDSRTDIESECITRSGERYSVTIPNYTLAANGEPDFLGNVLVIRVK